MRVNARRPFAFSGYIEVERKSQKANPDDFRLITGFPLLMTALTATKEGRGRIQVDEARRRGRGAAATLSAFGGGCYLGCLVCAYTTSVFSVSPAVVSLSPRMDNKGHSILLSVYPFMCSGIHRAYKWCKEVLTPYFPLLFCSLLQLCCAQISVPRFCQRGGKRHR